MGGENEKCVINDNTDNIAKHPKKQAGFFGDPAGNQLPAALRGRC